MLLPIPYGIRILCRPTYQHIYGQGPYASKLNDVEKDIQNWTNEKLGQPRTNALWCSLNIFAGVKELDTGLASANLWDWAADMQRMEEEHPKDIPCKSHVTQRSFHTSPTEGSVRT